MLAIMLRTKDPEKARQELLDGFIALLPLVSGLPGNNEHLTATLGMLISDLATKAEDFKAQPVIRAQSDGGHVNLSPFLDGLQQEFANMEEVAEFLITVAERLDGAGMEHESGLRERLYRLRKAAKQSADYPEQIESIESN